MAPLHPRQRALLVSVGFVACAVGGLVVAAPRGATDGYGGLRSAAGLHGGTPSSRPGRRDASGASPGHASEGVTATSTSVAPVPSTSVAPTTTIDVGTLAQTDAKPTGASSQFVADARLLWQAIVSDDPDAALDFFFPRTAYRQVKAISNPDGDYDGRLLGAFRSDVHRLHGELGADATRATFQGLDVPESAAQWIEPGVEYNKGSYWRVFGSTLRYEVDGLEHTLPVVSLISWRGEWYVVHLGPIP